jgi:NAD(P)-dependent dehydrogenase (short-subunit alcohol dehydrogenase family)
MSATRRIILITGVTRGLGRALAERFVDQGHTIIGCGRSPEPVRQLQERHPRPHDFTVMDVVNDRALKSWAERVLAEVGVPHLLLNNAALMNRSAPLWELSAAEFDPVIDVNIKGVVNVLRHFVPAMVQQRRGVIVNFSSGWGRSTSPHVAPYCATKYAIEGLTKALAQELPQGMAAVPLNPGVIDTDMLRSCWADSAGGYPSPEAWSEGAARFLLQLGFKDNGQSLSIT